MIAEKELRLDEDIKLLQMNLKYVFQKRRLKK
ncbi:hypothetical protein Clopa_1381 [Clostridium pasteurianum BC1]|uniref:Uncharacterized protein n=1 Tax=Clostridium pasteurianum BC1 TaxID=86416 RepID=R4K747_CLOPA|nr:hypothetical protein Clopa_1381 [Clostridium pasteurianum BC1]